MSFGSISDALVERPCRTSEWLWRRQVEREERMMRKRWILPLALQELVELVTGAGDEED